MSENGGNGGHRSDDPGWSALVNAPPLRTPLTEDEVRAIEAWKVRRQAVVEVQARRVHLAQRMSDIPTQIRDELVRQGISVNELARRAEYRSARHIRSVLASEHVPDDATISRLARALGVELVRPAVRFYPDGRVAECHDVAECHNDSDE